MCLGAGESGKSTVIKQLTFIHKQQLVPDERLSYVKVLQNNTVQCMVTLIREAEAFGYAFSDEERISAELILGHDQRQTLPFDSIADIDRLWQSEAVQLTYARRNEFWHLEATEYYFANAERYVTDGFVPSEEDMVMARKRTTGVVVTELDYGGIHWSCVDVGGQRSERRKWLNCFDNVKAIIYVVNLAGYCKVLFEDKAVNRMHESLNLFEATMSNSLFASTPVFIFLNKKDLFEQLIRDRNIDCCFPEYQGPNDLHSCIEYISEEYQRRMPPRSQKPTFLLLAARMKKDVQYCFEEVKDLLLEAHKKSIVKAKKALERVEKRNKEAGVNIAEEGVESGKDAETNKYKVRGLQGWEATRKPKVKRTLPITKSATNADANNAKPQSEEQKEGGEGEGDKAATVDRPSDNGDESQAVRSSRIDAPSASSPSDPQHSQAVVMATLSSSNSADVSGGEMSTTINVQSAAGHAPRPSQSSELPSALQSGVQTAMLTPRTEVRGRARSEDGVAEEDEEEHDAERQQSGGGGGGRGGDAGEKDAEDERTSGVKGIEETKEMMDEPLLSQRPISDAVITETSS